MTPPDAISPDTLAWALAPELRHLAEPLPSHGRIGPLVRHAGHVLASAEPSLSFSNHQGVLFLTASVNQLRSVEALMDAFKAGEAPRAAREPRWPFGEIRRWERAGRGFAHMARRLERSGGARLDPYRFETRLRLTERAALETSRRVALDAPDLLVVATQHSGPVRAAIAVARAEGVPVLYVPHAPVADNDEYRDLPFDVAALRGTREVAYYHSLGVSENLHIVGNLSLPTIPAPVLDGDAPILLAVSPDAPSRLAALVEIVASAVNGGAVTVACHPRSDVEMLRGFIPSNWTVTDPAQRTLDKLRLGPPVVVQHSSGLAWEALHLGIPTIEVRLDASPPNYPFIAEPAVLFAADAGELRTALATARGRSSDERERARLRAWADEWCALTGPEAVAATRGVIELVRGRLPGPMLLDSWAEDPWRLVRAAPSA